MNCIEIIEAYTDLGLKIGYILEDTGKITPGDKIYSLIALEENRVVVEIFNEVTQKYRYETVKVEE